MNYWSCTKFADYIRGNPKPLAATAEDWDTWDSVSKASNSVRHWIAEVALDNIQRFLRSPYTLYNSMMHYYHNRWVSKSHALTSNLPRGVWHDVDTRILHCVFDELVNFVEVEKANMLINWSDENRKKYWKPWYQRPFKGWRSSMAGLSYLEWEMSLTNADFLAEDDINRNNPSPSQQALNACEIFNLYTWWKLRDSRPDTMDESGWSDFCDMHPHTIFKNMDPAIETEKTKCLDKYNELEQKYEAEDEAMLIRLIQIRKGLWT